MLPAVVQPRVQDARETDHKEVQRSKHLRLPAVSVFVHDGLAARVSVNDDVPAEADAALHLLRPADERAFVVGVSSAADRAEQQPEQVLRELPNI